MKKAHIIIDPLPKGLVCFSLSQTKPMPYMCSACRQGFFRIDKAQAHMEDKHPERISKLKKSSNYKPRAEKLRKPDAAERRQIRKAIQESHDHKRQGLIDFTTGKYS